MKKKTNLPPLPLTTEGYRARGKRGRAASPWGKGPTVNSTRARKEFAKREIKG